MDYNQLIENLKQLKLSQMAAQLLEVSRQSKEKKQTHEQFLWELVQWELKQRNENKVNRLLKQSKVPLPKLLSSYSLKNRTGITQNDIDLLGQGDWVRKGTNVVLFGGFGVGKTHLALGISRALCQRGLSCYFSTSAQLMNMLTEEKRALRLSKAERNLDKFDLIVCDELGYVSATEEGAELFFQLIANRYERKSLLFTTNLTYSQWEKVFMKPLVTQAALDRILHHCQTFNIEGPSKRAEDARNEINSLTPQD